MMSIKGTETVTILRITYSGEIDDYGQSIATPSEIPVQNVLIGWGSSADKITEISEGIENSATLFFPRGTETKLGDKFRLPDGSIWLKNGGTINWKPQRGARTKPRPIVEITRAEG